MNKEQILQMAIAFDVPMPETCKEIEWEKPTFFYWVLFNGEYVVCTKTAYHINTKRYSVAIYNEKREIQRNEYSAYLDSELIPAPQMHEIASILPTYIVENGMASDLILDHNFGRHNGATLRLSYARIGNDKYSYRSFDNHFAETYAGIYKKIKQANLLEKGGKND